MILKTYIPKINPVQTQLLFEPKDAKVISLQIAKGETLKEHVSKNTCIVSLHFRKCCFTDDKRNSR